MPSLTALGQLESHIIDLDWSSCGQYLAAAEVEGAISVWSERQGWKPGPTHQLGCTSLSWHPRRSLLASCGQDGSVRFWDPAGPTASADAPDPWCNRLRWSASGTRLAVVGGKTLCFYDEQGQRTSSCQSPYTLSDVAWLPHEDTCVTASYLGLQAWKPDSTEPQRHYRWQGSCLRLAVSPNQKFLATGDQDKTVHFWETRFPNPERSCMMSGFATKVEQLAWDHESRYLATGGSCDVCLWECKGKGPAGKAPMVLKGDPQAYVSSLQFQPRRSLLAVGDELGRLSLWETRPPRRVFEGWLDSRVTSLGWNPRGDRLAAAAASGRVFLWQP